MAGPPGRPDHPEPLRGRGAYVDRHVAHVAHKIRPTTVDRLVEEATARFMPEAADRLRQEAADRRHLTIDHRQVSLAGTSVVYGELDLADALDLDDAISGIAGQLGDLGCTESLDVRRSLAAGELARRQLALDLDTSPDPTPRRRRTTRQTVLYVHLSEAAITGTGTGQHQIGRVENIRTPITADTIRAWCGHPDTAVVVKPVIDLAEHVHVESYETPDRLDEQTGLRDHTCVFPWCSRPARACHPDQCDCDSDHVIPHARGGPTCSHNIAPLCRRHHRLKTHTPWTYTVLEPGSYLWSSPHGYQFLRDHEGTLDVTRDRRSPPGDPPEE